jgi:putative membrane protein insertion efficiency factor
MKKIREIRLSDILKYFILPLILLIALSFAGVYLSDMNLHIIIKVASYVTGGVVSYPILKRFAIGLVLLYKAFAPMSLRKQCRFEPSCSTYMVMAINKYGLFKGVYKGIRRITRCCPPNGGIDYP